VIAAVCRRRRIEIDPNAMGSERCRPIRRHLDAVVALEHVTEILEPRERGGVARGDGIESRNVVRRQRGDESSRDLIDLGGSGRDTNEKEEKRPDADHGRWN